MVRAALRLPLGRWLTDWHSQSMNANALTHVRRLMAGNGLAQALQFLSILLLSRLYAPDDFGLLAQVQSIATFAAIVATLQMHLVVPLSGDGEQARRAAATAQTVCLRVQEQQPFIFGTEQPGDIDNARGFPVAEVGGVCIHLPGRHGTAIDLCDALRFAGIGVQFPDRGFFTADAAETGYRMRTPKVKSPSWDRKSRLIPHTRYAEVHSSPGPCRSFTLRRRDELLTTTQETVDSYWAAVTDCELGSEERAVP